MVIPLQLGFADYEQTYAKKKTRRQIFLDEMEATLPWDSFLALIQLVYYKPTAKGGRPPFGSVPLRGVKPEARMP